MRKVKVLNSKKIYVWSSFIMAALLVLLAIGTLFDQKVSELLYFRDNAFGKIYESIGKMPAFVIAVFACFTLGEGAAKTERKQAKRYFFYICGYLAGILAFIDLGEMLFSSTAIALAIGAVLSVPLSVIAYFTIRKAKAEELALLKKWALVALFSVAVIGVAVFLLKTIWGRARYVDTQAGDAAFSPWYKLVRVDGDSFPSGHAAFGGTLFLLLPLCGISDKFRGREKEIFSVAALFVAVVMIARITDGHHYLSDVTVGFGLAFVVELVVMTIAYGKKMDRIQFNAENKLERLLNAVF